MTDARSNGVTEGRGASASRVREVAWVFLQLGVTAFGGPAAHVAMMEREVVARRGWVSRREFLDLYGATNFIPGPNSTEMAIHLGYRRAGWVGLVVAGVCFIVPAAVIVLGCAWGYVRYGERPQVEMVFRWVAPVIVTVVAQAIWSLGKTALLGEGERDWRRVVLWVVAAGAVVATWVGVNELAVLGCAGLVMAACALVGGKGEREVRVGAVAPVAGVVSAGGLAAGVATPGPIFWVFAKIGSVLFGSGYVLLAFLQAELVERRGWLTQQQMMDAVAVGQFTPGPVFTTATFVGYLLAGWQGAGAATAGIFLPAFVFVAVTAPLVPLLRRSRVLAGALDGVNAASLALMVVVTVELARVAFVSWGLVVVAVVALGLMMKWKVNSAWLVLGAGVVGVVVGW